MCDVDTSCWLCRVVYGVSVDDVVGAVASCIATSDTWSCLGRPSKACCQFGGRAQGSRPCPPCSGASDEDTRIIECRSCCQGNSRMQMNFLSSAFSAPTANAKAKRLRHRGSTTTLALPSPAVKAMSGCGVSKQALLELASTPVDRLKSIEVGDGLADQQQYPISQLGTWRRLRRGEHMRTAPAVARPPSRAHARSRLHALGRAGVGLAVAGCRGASIWAAPQP